MFCRGARGERPNGDSLIRIQKVETISAAATGLQAVNQYFKNYSTSSSGNESVLELRRWLIGCRYDTGIADLGKGGYLYLWNISSKSNMQLLVTCYAGFRH
jgi:hypothetical protein